MSEYMSIKDILRRYMNTTKQAVDSAKNGVISVDITEFEWTDGIYINSYGHESTHEKYSATGYISLSGITKITFPAYFSTGGRCALYDRTKKTLAAIENTGADGTYITINNPDSTYAYARVSCKTANKASFYITAESSDSLQGTVLNLETRVTDLEENGFTADETNPLATLIKDGGFCSIFRTIGVVGDSLSSGEMAYGGSTDEGTTKYKDMYEHSWLQYIARTCGSTGYNFSCGGLSTRTFLSDDRGKFTMMHNADNKCQAYFIALGHNDYNQGVPVGTADDIDLTDCNNNADTYYGNYAKIIAKIKEVSPHAKIFVITMRVSYGESGGWNDAIRHMATIFDNVYVLDIKQYGYSVPDWYKTEGHYNAMGYLAYGWEVATYVDWIIRNNRNDFTYVQFINTEYEDYII